MDEEFTTDIDTSSDIPTVEVDTPDLSSDEFFETPSDIVEDAPMDLSFDNEEPVELLDDISEDVSIDASTESDNSIETLDAMPEDDIELLDINSENSDESLDAPTEGDNPLETLDTIPEDDIELLDINSENSDESLEEDISEDINALDENDIEILDIDEDSSGELLDESEDNAPSMIEEDVSNDNISSQQDDQYSDSQKIEDLVNRIQDSDISDENKAELLNELDSGLDSLRDNDTIENVADTNDIEEITFDEEEAVPVKVLTQSGYDTGIHKPDYQQELYDLDEGIVNARKPYDDIVSSLEEEAARIYSDDSLSNEEKIELLNDTKTKIQQTEELWKDESAEYFSKRDELQNKVNSLENDNLMSEEISHPFEITDNLIDAQSPIAEPDFPDSSDSFHVQDTEEISSWLGDINPNFDEFDTESPYCNNCGSCAWSVYNRLNGDTSMVASAENIPYNDQMNALTGMEQVSMSPEEIQQRLLEQGDGAHAIIGIDRAEGPGHWFNAACVDGKVVAIDGQTGEILDWPPDYGDVVNWEMSVKKGDK